MDKFEEYEALLSEENITAVRERREAIARAIDTLIAQMDEFNAERRRLDEKDQHLYVLARKLDEAYARLSRGVRYTTQSKKRLVQRSWDDETHLWVEQYLLHWVRKVLQEGPKTVGTMSWDKPGRFAIADAIRLMEQHPEEFTFAKGPKPQRKYARADYVWSLKANPSRPLPPAPPPFWNVEADFSSRDQQRPRTLSERLHEMLEQAIQAFYSNQSSSIFGAFANLYYKDFARAYHSLKQAYDYMKIERDVAKQMAADQATQAKQPDKTENGG
jgi:exonuclease VII large subunit